MAGAWPSTSMMSRAVVAASSCVCMARSEEHTSELQSPCNLVCRLLLEKKKKHKSCNFNNPGVCCSDPHQLMMRKNPTCEIHVYPAHGHIEGIGAIFITPTTAGTAIRRC